MKKAEEMDGPELVEAVNKIARFSTSERNVELLSELTKRFDKQTHTITRLQSAQKRLDDGHHFVMGASERELTAGRIFEAFGWRHDGLDTV